MTMSPVQRQQRPNYGIDAPGVVWRFALFGVASLLLGGGLIVGLALGLPQWMKFIAPTAMATGLWLVTTALVMLWGSKVGKLKLRDRIIGDIPWRGDETVLDVGCGHGLMLIAAAKQLRRGKAIGVDLWQTTDQHGNSRAATWRNIELENVADRAELVDGDARLLPFPDGYFDVVLSSWAIHNIYNREGRDTAIREIVRVLKPGGRLAIVDIHHTPQYAEVLRAVGMTDVHRSWPNFLFFIPSFSLTAIKL